MEENGQTTSYWERNISKVNNNKNRNIIMKQVVFLQQRSSRFTKQPWGWKKNKLGVKIPQNFILFIQYMKLLKNSEDPQNSWYAPNKAQKQHWIMSIRPSGSSALKIIPKMFVDASAWAQTLQKTIFYEIKFCFLHSAWAHLKWMCNRKL